MTKNELKYVLAIEECGTIAKAAQRLGLDRSSLSRCLQKLEEEFGTRLFTQATAGAVPTYAGRLYLQTARQIIREYDNMLFEISELVSLHQGRITVGSSCGQALRLVLRALPAFAARFPGVAVDIPEGGGEELETMLLGNRLDLAVAHRAPGVGQFRFEPLFSETIWVVMAPDSPLCIQASGGSNGAYIPADALRQTPVIFAEEPGLRELCGRIFKKLGAAPNVAYLARGAASAGQMAAAGLGAALLPEGDAFAIKRETGAAIFRMEKHLDMRWTLGAVIPIQTEINRAALEFLQVLRESVAPQA